MSALIFYNKFKLDSSCLQQIFCDFNGKRVSQSWQMDYEKVNKSRGGNFFSYTNIV